MLGTIYLSNIGYTLGFIFGGLCAIIFRRPLSKLTLLGQEKTWGFHFSDAARRRNERLAFPLVGVCSIALGIVSLFLSPHLRG